MLATAQITGSKEAMAEAITGAAGPDALPAPRTANRAAPLATVASVDEDGVGAMKVAELKARLKSLGVKSSGTKPELQARLRGFAESDAKGTLRVHGGSPQPQTTDQAMRPWTSAREQSKLTTEKEDVAEWTRLKNTRLQRASIKCVRSLYRRCLRSAQMCPDEKWQESIRLQVRSRFRESSSDTLPIRLSIGEAELGQMESLITNRRDAAAAKERRLAQP